MHALMFTVKIKDVEQAQQFLKERIVPGVSQAPGFVRGAWANIGGDRGRSMILFESEEAAKAVAEQDMPIPEAVEIESVEIGEVVAEA